MESSVYPFVVAELHRKEFKDNSVKLVNILNVADCHNKEAIESANYHQDKLIEASIGEYITKSYCNKTLCNQNTNHIVNEYEKNGKLIREVSFFCFSEQQLILFCEELLKAVQSGRHYSKPIPAPVKGEWDENDLV